MSESSVTCAELNIDLQGLETRLLEHNERVRLDLLEQMEQVRLEVLERTEKVETTLLKEFRKWAISFESRFKSTMCLSSDLTSALSRSKSG